MVNQLFREEFFFREAKNPGTCLPQVRNQLSPYSPARLYPLYSCSCALFCTVQKTTGLLSSDSALFTKNTRGRR
jgi:hypothetical protein